MRIGIDEELKQKCPRTALGCVTAQVAVGDAPAELLAEMQRRVEEVLRLAEPRAVLESQAITSTRAAYKALGKDPARYRGSAEALLRRVIAGKGLPRINAVVDVINLVSVESRLSIGLYDLGQVRGDITFRAGRAGETYKGIGKYDLNLEGLPVFCDELGPHGSPTSDSERTMVTGETKRVIAAIISFSGKEGLERWSQRLSELFERYASATSWNKKLSVRAFCSSHKSVVQGMAVTGGEQYLRASWQAHGKNRTPENAASQGVEGAEAGTGFAQRRCR